MPTTPAIHSSAKEPVIPLSHSPHQADRLLFRGITGSFLSAPVVMLLTSMAATAAAQPELEVDSDVATAGFYQLRWQSDEPVELEEADDAEFTSAEVIYSGTDAARVMSGKPDGVFYYRVRGTADGAQSNVVKVTVRHHSLERALAFFSLGAIVFLATLLLIATGARSRTAEK